MDGDHIELHVNSMLQTGEIILVPKKVAEALKFHEKKVYRPLNTKPFITSVYFTAHL